MRQRTQLTSALLALCLALPGAPLTLAQDATPEATPDTPVKATPAPAEATLEALLEVTAEAPVEITETPISDLRYDTAVIGRLNSATPAQDWPLPLESADRLRIVVERLDGNLLPSIVLLDAAGQEIGNSYGSEEDGATATIDNITLAEAGTWTVRVEREDGPEGLSQGLYRLTVVPLAAAEDAAANQAIVGPVEIGEPIEATISAGHWSQRYTYTAEAADAIRVIAERTHGTLQPQIEILDASGSSLANGYTENSGDLAIADRVSLPSAGEYTLIVSRSQGFNGATEGGYRLTVEMIGSGEGSPNLAGVAGDIRYDEAITGEITPERWYEDWTLTAEAADTLTVTVERIDAPDAGNLIPEVILLGGSGQEVMHGYAESADDRAVIRSRQLDSAGTYTVRVTREQEQTGTTAGQYRLVVSLVGAGEGSASLSGTNGALVLGEPVTGEVTPGRWADTWTFEATAEQQAVVTVKRASGTLIPVIEIRDGNGQRMSSGYYNDTRDAASVQYYFPTSGTYQIVVSRDRDQNGVTTGTYTLRIDPTE